jgi:putative tryptophan/tyrosine transport system substrate-binding protein
MDRRTFIGSVAGGLLAAPLAARAQKTATAVIGYLSAGSPNFLPSGAVAAVRQGLNETGYVEGKNVAIEFRWAENHYDRLPALAADLVSRRVAVLVTFGGAVSARAAKSATSTIPIVAMGVSDPVGLGFAESLGRPGGNLTSVGIQGGALLAKRMQLLHEMAPKATVVAMLLNPDNAGAEFDISAAQDASRSLGEQLHILRARTEQDIDAAFATLVQLRVRALLVASDPFLASLSRRKQIVGLAARHAVPAVYEYRGFADDGGLMSYGPNLFEVYRQAGIYAGKILNGAKAGDLPALNPTKFELVINMKTAKALGLTIPQSLLLRADDVIQ